jgi:hypothetical protein
MRILVTGGAGLVGSHYVRTMLTGGYPGYAHAEVTVLDKLTYAGNLANLEEVAGHPRLRCIPGDVCDPVLLAAIVHGHDAVLNFAAETHVDRSIKDAAQFVATNVAGVQTLLQACLDAGVRRVIQVSTDEVYVSIASGSWTEDSPRDPSSPYASSKAAGDLMALDLPHRRRRRTEQPGADPGDPGLLRGWLGHGGSGAGPQGTRPAVLAGRFSVARPRLRPTHRVRRGPGSNRALVRLAPGLVGAVEAGSAGSRQRTRPVSG